MSTQSCLAGSFHTVEKIATFIIMFYRQKMIEELSEKFRVLFQQWDLEVTEFKEKKEKLKVGITVNFT